MLHFCGVSTPRAHLIGQNSWFFGISENSNLDGTGVLNVVFCASLKLKEGPEQDP